MKLTRTGLLAAALAAAAALAPATASGVTVSPGGSFRAQGLVQVTFGGLPLTCARTTIEGTVGTDGVGRVGALSFLECWGVFGAGTIVPTASPRTLDVTYSDVTRPATIRWRAPGYAFAVRPLGTCGFTASGPVDFVTSVSALPLVQTRLPMDTTLLVSNATGCTGIVANGDAITMRGDLALSPAQTITP